MKFHLKPTILYRLLPVSGPVLPAHRVLPLFVMQFSFLDRQVITTKHLLYNDNGQSWMITPMSHQSWTILLKTKANHLF